MIKAIRITKHTLNTIEAVCGIRKESLELIAQRRDTYLVFGPEIIHGRQTYHESIFKDLYRFTDGEVNNQFAEVIFT
jgi:hypothetical protein